MSFDRKIIRNKIRKKFGNKLLQGRWQEYQNADDKRKNVMLKQLDKMDTYKKPKIEKKPFNVKYMFKDTKVVKTIVIQATDKDQAEQMVLDMYEVTNKTATNKKTCKVKVKSVKEVKEKKKDKK